MKNNRHYTDALFEEFDFFNNEVDNLLIEDLDTMLRYYNNLQNWDKQELLNFLIKDPTWNSNKEQGQYSKWILDKLNRNLLDSSYLGHLYDALKRFEDNKKYLKNKDINKFKSLQDIDTYLNDDNNYNELSHSQIVRQHRRDKQNVDLDNDAELIYEDSDWEIWIPKTYAASCKLGQGSSWCTASTETSEYFDKYSKRGPLYIILNKHNKKEKYQFHAESDSYMNIKDQPIDLLDFYEAEHTKKLIDVLRQYDKYLGNQCDNIINEAKKVREKINNFLQKLNSPEIIKYPTQKDIFKEFNKFISYNSIEKEFNKINNIKLEIENSVEGIESGEFKNISWIKQVIFEKNSKLKYIDDEAFYWCDSLKSIVIPDSVTSIGDYAFYYCSRLTNITLPENATSIGHGAFGYCESLTNIIIPDGVTSIGDEAFNSCKSLTSIVIPNSVTSIGNKAFSFCDNLTSVVIPDSITSIEAYAFWNCSKLTNIILPESITRIGHSAFYGCDSLKSITIPEGVTRIGRDAFKYCDSLKSIVIPNSVKNIYSGAFHAQNLVIKTSNSYVIEYCIKNNIKYEKID